MGCVSVSSFFALTSNNLIRSDHDFWGWYKNTIYHYFYRQHYTLIFIGDCHLSSFFLASKKDIVSPAGQFGAPAWVFWRALFILTVQKFMEAPFSPAPEKRWLAPPKITSKMLWDSASLGGCMRDMNPVGSVVEVDSLSPSKQQAFVPSPSPAGVRGLGSLSVCRLWPHNIKRWRVGRQSWTGERDSHD